jgi:hypothetical protein
MLDRLKAAFLVLGLIGLGACHNDPFSLKPEVNVTLPTDPPPEAAPSGEGDDAVVDDAGEEAGAS